MATKNAKGPSMIETFQEFKETKNIDRTTLVSVLEESFRNVIAKMFGSDENFDVIVNPDKGDFEIHRNRIVVADGEVQDENKELSRQIERQKLEIAQLEKELKQLRIDNEFLRVAHTVPKSPEAVAQYKKQVAKMVRDIDRCIKQLKA